MDRLPVCIETDAMAIHKVRLAIVLLALRISTSAQQIETIHKQTDNMQMSCL